MTQIVNRSGACRHLGEQVVCFTLNPNLKCCTTPTVHEGMEKMSQVLCLLSVSHSNLSRVCGLEFRIMVRGLGFRVEVQGLGIRVRGKELGAFKFQDEWLVLTLQRSVSGFRVEGV